MGIADELTGDSANRKMIMTNFSPAERLKRMLAEGQTALGLWITLESATISEIAVHLGLDWVCIDLEHGELDYQEVAGHLRALRRTDTVALVRVSSVDHGQIQKAIGLGADGIIVPRIRTAEEVERAVCYAKYPPTGLRGMGVERATVWGTRIAYARTANSKILVIPLIEHVDAGKNIDAIASVAGVDACFFGPADYSASAGFAGQWEGPGVAEELLRIKDRLRSKSIACGIVATDPANAKLRISQGFKMLGLGVDCTLLVKVLAELMSNVGNMAARLT